MQATTRLVRVLLVAQDARAPGGVNNYLRILRLRLRSRILTRRFTSGRRHGERGLVRMVARIIFDQVRFAKLARSGFDVVQLNPSLDLASLPRDLVYAFLTPRRARRPSMLLFYRGWNWDSWNTLQARWLSRALLRAAHARMDVILVLSASFREALVRTGVPRSKIRLTTTMFDGATLEPELAHAEKEPGRITFMSRFVPAKGASIALQAFAQVRAQVPSATLVMVGDGPERASLEKEAEKLGLMHAVRFTGYLHGRAKMAELARSTIFLLPSCHPEGMPNALLEAMAAGNAIISSSVGAIPEIITDPEQLLSAVTPDELAIRLAAFLGQPEETFEKGQRNQDTAWATWESQVVADRMGQLYQKLAA